MIYTLDNDYLIVKVSTMGATLVSFIDKKTNKDIVLGYDDEKDYLLKTDYHIGATVARNANRMGRGKFSIDGVEYQISINDGENSLHSGVGDLSFKGYKVKEVDDNHIVLTVHDTDGSGGFPGDLDLEVTYKLEDNNLIYSFTGLCDKDSILNVTNHSYFNLDEGRNNILNHKLKVNTNKLALNTGSMASDKIINVKDTPFDFTEEKIIGDNFKMGHDNLSNGGIDHNYVYETLNEKIMATYSNEELKLTITSDLPDMHIYTANYLGPVKGKNNLTYGQYDGICFECQYYPNGINYEGVIKPIIKANVPMKHFIKYTLESR